MQTHIIEVTNQFNWGKFMLMRYDREWQYPSHIDMGRPMLHGIGTGHNALWVLDLQTGEGAMFYPGGIASIDLNRKHRIWCCPMYEPFLTWLYKQDLSDITKLPKIVELSQEETAEHTGMQGHRRQGDQCGEGTVPARDGGDL